MPRRTRRRDNRSQSQGRQGAISKASQPKKRRRARSGTWITSQAAKWTGIGAIGVAALAALVIFGVRTSSGDDFEFSMYAGGDVVGGSERVSFSTLFPAEKPLVLNFWAGQCPPCRAEMPSFQAVYDRYQDDFTLLGLDIGPFTRLGTNQDAGDLLRDLNITYPTGYAHDRAPVTRYRITSMPTTLFFTADGKLFKRREGFLDQGRMTETIEDLLRASVGSSRTTDNNPTVHRQVSNQFATVIFIQSAVLWKSVTTLPGWTSSSQASRRS